jgi:3-phenylpropionate/trans-cinnamate dioxygenase ferredoxin subunit
VSRFVRVGRVHDFAEGVIQRFEVQGEDVAVVNWRNRFYAFDDHCTHWGISLQNGYITKDNEICCLFHYAVFDMATGKVLDGPAQEDLPVYDVRIEGDDVLVGPRIAD